MSGSTSSPLKASPNEGHAQFGDRSGKGLRPRTAVSRRMIRVAGLRALHGVEKRRGVAHAAGNHVILSHAGPALGPVRAGGDAAAGGFEADHAAMGGRYADGTSAIAAMRRRDNARRHGRRRAAAGAARREFGIPGVQCRPAYVRFGSDRQRQLRRIGLPENYQPGLAVAANQRGVPLRHEPVKQTAGVAGGLSSIVGADILQQEGHAVKRTVAPAFGHGFAGRDHRRHGPRR